MISRAYADFLTIAAGPIAVECNSYQSQQEYGGMIEQGGFIQTILSVTNA
jgi:hypothetical protein